MNIIYSKTIASGISYLEEAGHSSQEIYTKQQEIFSAMFDFIGLQPTISQVNLYPHSGKALGTGFYTFQKNIPLAERPWYQDAVERNGNRLLTAPAPLSFYMSASPFADDPEYIALVRMYYDNAHQIAGAVEVLQSRADFFFDIEDIVRRNRNISILIAETDGGIIYPAGETESSSVSCYRKTFAERGLPSGAVHLITDSHGKKEAVIHTSLPSVGWDLYITEPDSVIAGSLLKPVLFFVCILILILILTLFLCFVISQRTLSPISKLQQTFDTINLDTLLSSDTGLMLPDSHYVEIKALIDDFHNMYKKLNHSTALMLQSKEEEIRAKEIATQSLMKPHFLYNNLANISIMAEENMNQQIIALTENLCDYLRYTSTAATRTVSIKDEFFYTEKYLLCMKVRYKDRLRYSFSPDDAIQDVAVPKLVLQSLVENALKYAFYNNPPWILSVTASHDRNNWYITVEDNGVGFSDEDLTEIRGNLSRIREHRDISQLKIGGMGLQNVYLRLLLMYGDSVAFTLANSASGGACITIGGKLDYDRPAADL